MTKAGELYALAERCEKAIFPCPDDASAAEVVAIRSAICHLMTGRGYDAYSPDYVGSIDAALTLVPDGCREWHCGQNIKTGKGQAYLLDPATMRSPVYVHGETPALALCAAALRARAASGIETEGHDRAAGRGAKHESPTAESGDAQNIAQDIGGPSQ